LHVSLKKLGRYDLVRVLGKGAMGVVYEGRDPNLDRRVAIKTVKVENLSEEAATEYEGRFRTEARSAARLQHPNIVSVYDSDRDGDVAFLVMEYIQGDDLKHHLDRGIRYSLEQSLKMIRDLLSALDYAHKQGIVHRDIKPANLLIEPGGRVKLTDFGVARIQNSGEATRTQGSMVGTLKYMSPEQVQGQKIDSRADLFSVGVVLYQLLTDKRPFDGDNDFSIIHQIIGHTPAPPSSFNNRLPSAIDAVVARALAKDREHRFATARDFASALQSAIRRAEDATVVPPADPFKKKDGAGTGSRGHRSLTGSGNLPTGGSTVTQEVELVYWKDIKDSTEPEELQGFLDKFPDGIYADLARRRLRKLASGSGAPDQTVLSDGNSSPGEPDPEATRQRSGTSPTHAVAPPANAWLPHGAAEPARTDSTVPPLDEIKAVPAAAAQALPSSGTDTDSISADPAGAAVASTRDDTTTIVEARVPEPQHESAFDPEATAIFVAPGISTPLSSSDAAGASTAPSVGKTEPPVVRGAPVTKPKSKQPLIAVLSAVGVLAAVGIAAVMMMGRDGDESTATMPAAPPPIAAPGVVVDNAIVPTVGPAPAPAPNTAAPASAAAPKPAVVVAARPAAPARRPASAVKAQAEDAPVVESRVEETAAPPPPRREERRVAAAPSPPPPALNPAEICRDKVFLSKEFCLAEQCEKPGARSHPLCVKRREEAKLREESKVRY
jgi:eukaryotic-like serine/threonine-protein kinase